MGKNNDWSWLNRRRFAEMVEAITAMPELTARERYIFFALASFVGEDGKCFPSYSSISRRSGVDRRSVMRAVQKFVAAGMIKISKRYIPVAGVKKTKNHYVVWCPIPSSNGGNMPPIGGANGGNMPPEMVAGMYTNGGRNVPLTITINDYHITVDQKRYKNFCEEYGQALVHDYIERVLDWEASKGKKTTKDYLARARNFMKKDNVKPLPKDELLEVSEFVRRAEEC